MSDVVIDVGKRHIREINEEIQAAANAGKSMRVVNTLSRHNLGVGLPPNCGFGLRQGWTGNRSPLSSFFGPNL